MRPLISFNKDAETVESLLTVSIFLRRCTPELIEQFSYRYFEMILLYWSQLEIRMFKNPSHTQIQGNDMQNMTRRLFLRNLAATTAALSITSTVSAKTRKQPNILWISCEDISSHLGC